MKKAWGKGGEDEFEPTRKRNEMEKSETGARESHAEREDSWERVVQGVGGGLGKSTSS